MRTTAATNPHRAGWQPPTSTAFTLVSAPSTALMSADGGISSYAEGCYVNDRRIVSRLTVSVDGVRLSAVASEIVDPRSAVFQFAVPGHGDREPQTTVWLTLARSLDANGLVDNFHVVNHSRETVVLPLFLTIEADFAEMSDVRNGAASATGAEPRLLESALMWERGSEGAVTAVAAPAPTDCSTSGMGWTIALDPGESCDIAVRITVGDVDESDTRVFVDLAAPKTCVTLQRFLRTSVADLDALRMRSDSHEFFAAGAPWYLTLFGRDALWAARMVQPHDPEIGVSTLEALAVHQGDQTDPLTAEQPGKIIHELRQSEITVGWPAAFYGTADATPLWVALFAELWATGTHRERMLALLPAFLRAVTWVTAQIEESGLVRYDEIPGLGAIHQGWKDSRDCVFDRDGNDLPFPLALCEIQGYAYEATSRAAAIMTEVDLPGVERVARAAEKVRATFHRDFWVGDDVLGRFPALAVSADGARADVLTSNIGHLIGTGILEPGQERALVAVLLGEELLAPTGIRTLGKSQPRYSATSYHNGSIWPHDVGIIIRGLLRSGFAAEASDVAERLVAASAHFDGRLPELWGGDALPGTSRPLAYPTACRPQAWSAASALVCLEAAQTKDDNE